MSEPKTELCPRISLDSEPFSNVETTNIDQNKRVKWLKRFGICDKKCGTKAWAGASLKAFDIIAKSESITTQLPD